MAPPRGSQWSKDPLRDRREDELAVDLEIADTLERAAAVLRSRRPRRLELAERAAAQTRSDSPVASKRVA
jgi:hypothetical protein